MERELRWDACWNIRDLGGYEIASGRRTRWKRVVRAGNLSRLTEAGRDALIAYGVRSVIDVRDPREFAADLDPFHERGAWAGRVNYVNEPLISEAEWTAIRDPEIMRQGYIVTLRLSKQNIARVMSAIAAAPPGGVVIHCHAGKERTGVVAALLLALAGVPDEVIADDYVASDPALASLYEEWAAREEDPEKRSRLLRGFASEPAHMLLPLEDLRSQGGVEVYLRDAGLRDEELRALRERLVTSDDAPAHVPPADNVRIDIGTPRTPVPASFEYETLAAQFRYSAPASVSLRATSVRREGDLVVEDIRYSSPLGGDVPAWLVAADGQGMRAAILLLHSSNSSRDQLMPEAEAYARRGAGCLAITAAHSRPGRPRFPSYTVEDREDVIQTVMDLRAGLDLLLLRGIDQGRLGFVGLSYGADYGAVFCAVDNRLRAAAFISGGTLRDYFARWCPKHVLPDYVRVMDTVSPDRYLPAVAGTRLLFQNGRNDKVYTQQEMTAFRECTSAPKVLRSYDTDHLLNDEATQERLNWLSGELDLSW